MTIPRECKRKSGTFVQDVSQPALLLNHAGKVLDSNSLLADLLNETLSHLLSTSYQELADHHHILPPFFELNQKSSWSLFAIEWHRHSYEDNILLLGKLRHKEGVNYAAAVGNRLEKITGEQPDVHMNMIDCLMAAQEYYENILAAMPGNVYWMDKQGTYLGCNKNMAEMLKLNSVKDMLGKRHSDFLQGEVAEKIIDTDMGVMAADKPYVLEEYGWGADGMPAIYLTNKVPLHDRSGKVIGLLGTSFDVSDRKKAEKQLKQAKEIAGVANETKLEFVANMSHDIRTPFCGIYSLIELLREQEEDAEKRQLLGEVAQSAKSLLDFLNQILELTEHESGSIPVSKRQFDLREEIDSLVDLLQAQARSSGLDFFVEYDEKLPSKIVGDEVRIHRVLLNLLSNAFKFTKQGSVTLSVTFRRQQLKLAMLELKVKDTGIGIPVDKQSIIFEQFTRLTPSNKGIYSGAGLGLWIVKKILDDLGGTISVVSQEGGGSAFTGLIPVELLTDSSV